MGLMTPSKGAGSDWIKNQDPSICCLQETHFRQKDTYSLKIKGWRTIYHSDGPQKKAEVAILISDKLKFIPKTVVRDEDLPRQAGTERICDLQTSSARNFKGDS